MMLYRYSRRLLLWQGLFVLLFFACGNNTVPPDGSQPGTESGTHTSDASVEVPNTPDKSSPEVTPEGNACPGTPVCAVDTKECTSQSQAPGTYKVCVKDAKGCPNWGEEKKCATGEHCDNGQCIKKDCPKPPCQLGQKLCESKNSEKICEKDSSGCIKWSTAKTCPKGQLCDAAAQKCQAPNNNTCKPGSTKPCYTGDPKTQGVGACKAGQQTCKQDGSGYDKCTGESLPQKANCDGKDNDCDGKVDCSDHSSDLTMLLQGVKSIAVPGVPGSLLAFTHNAFPVAFAKTRDNTKTPLYESVVVASKWGKGRIVAFSHGGYLASGALSVGETKQLLVNAIHWAGGNKSTKDPSPKVLILGSRLTIGTQLKSQGIQVTQQTSETPPQDLKPYKVLILRGASVNNPQHRQAVNQFVQNGGGILIADTAWGWAQLNPKKDVRTEFSGNILLHPTGLIWTGELVSKVASYNTQNKPDTLLHVRSAIDLLIQHADGKANPTAAQLAQAAHTLTLAARWLPGQDKAILPMLAGLLKKYESKLIPTAKNPIKPTDALLRALIAYQVGLLKRQKPSETKAHPAAKEFPGSVPTAAKRVTLTVKVDTKTPRWHSTGLYAAPGDLITVTTPASAVNKGLLIRIGAHKDKVWHKEKWSRIPEITRNWPLNATKVQVANAFGGAIFVEVPKGSNFGVVSIQIANGVRAPMYIHGVTKVADWRSTIRNYPAPWAEIASKTLIISVPSSAIRKLDDPDKVMAHWDKVQDANADLAVISRNRPSPERMVTDQQISAGYMHAGYPIMTHLDVIHQIANPTHMTQKGGWGFYHELGHNHQSRYWTFDGTVEVTVNLFSLYVYEMIHNNKQPRTNIYGKAREDKIKNYIKAGKKFDTWKRDPWLALIMYMQLQEAFGWSTYKKVFAEYHKTPASQLPKTDAQERDQWMVRFSKAIGKNLGPFFQAWGVPTSQQARNSIATLPKWMPKNFPPKP